MSVSRYGPPRRKVRRPGDTEAGEPVCPAELTAKYERLAHWGANKYRRRLKADEYDDALQVARLAIFQSALTWDRWRGVLFLSYAGQSVLNNLWMWYVRHRRLGLTMVGDGHVRANKGGPLPPIPDHVSHVTGADGDPVNIFDFHTEPEPTGLRWPADEWRRLLEPLTEPQRYVIVGLYVRGLTEQELAEEMGVGRQNVWAHKRKALDRLRWHNTAEALTP